MGIIGCQVDNNFEQKEILEELQIEDDNDSLKNNYYKYKSKLKNDISDSEFINQDKKSKYSKYGKIFNRKKIHSKININKKIFNLKQNNIYKLIQTKLFDNTNYKDDLKIISPRNKMNLDNYNEVTDEYTIKNETVVYNKENSKDILLSNSNSNEVKEENKLKEKAKSNQNDNFNSNKIQNNVKIEQNEQKISQDNNENYSKSFVIKNKNISKQLNLNQKRQTTNEKKKKASNIKINKYLSEKNNKSKDNKKNMSNKKIPNNKKDIKIKKNITPKNNTIIKNPYMNIKNNINNMSYNNIQSLKDMNLYPLYYSFHCPSSKKSGNRNTYTLQNKNIELKRILFHPFPIIQKEEIAPLFGRKTYQEDLFSRELNIDKNNSEPKNKNSKKKYLNHLFDSSQKYYILNNSRINDNSEIVEKLNDIYHVLYNQNKTFIQNNEKLSSYKKRKNPVNIYNNRNIPISRKDTDYQLKNRSYNNPNKNDSNSFFSLFNNSTNLSINFINKANKFSKSAKKMIPYLGKKNIKNKDNQNFITFNRNTKIDKQNLSNNNLNKGNIINKKTSANCSRKNKMNYFSNSYNNLIDNKKNKSTKSNKNQKINYCMNLLSNPYKDIIEVYLPKKSGKSLIDNEIIRNIINNKYILSYKIINSLDTDKILNDGFIYKLIDNIEYYYNNEDYKYELLSRYFQITKNCFKYYNNIYEAINEKDKPLVQFDIRYIKSIEIMDNNILKNYKINGNKNIEIIFCIYLNQNNDFFVFAHNNLFIGNNIINILLFLKRYYAKK